MPTLNLLMVCNAGKVPDDVEPAFTDEAQREQLRHGNIATLPSLGYIPALIN